MQLILLLLKSGQTLISLSEQLEYEPRCHLIQPYEVSGKTKVTLTSWPPYTDEKDILLHSDSLLTVVDPTEKLRDQYLKKIGKTLDDLKPSQEQVLLNEDENVPEYIDDEYEPMYQEID